MRKHIVWFETNLRYGWTFVYSGGRQEEHAFLSSALHLIQTI